MFQAIETDGNPDYSRLFCVESIEFVAIKPYDFISRYGIRRDSARYVFS